MPFFSAETYQPWSVLITTSPSINVQAKSIVQPKGVPNSSFRAYFLPIEALESSTRLATPSLRIFRARHELISAASCTFEFYIRTDFVDESAEAGILRDGDNEAFDGGNERRE